jgi:TonB-dependent starch-binding outer membrane protein SusC
MSRRIREWLTLALVLCAAPSLAQAQERGSISGRVTDAETTQPLVNVFVSVGGTNLGGVTNQDGRYLISNVPAGSQEVRVAMLGYSATSQRVNVTAGAPANADFTLKATAVQLEGIVATATGAEQRKREIGNSVAKISTETIDKAPVQTLTNLLQGRASAVVITQQSGSAGTGSRVRIRGNSSVSLDGTPLVIVDGIRVTNEVESTGLFTGGTTTTRWDDINPADIETIEILKGPAASALYGTAAANGVIQITTRRGTGGRTQIQAYAERTGMHVPESIIPDNFRARGFRTDLNARGDCSLVERSRGVCTTIDSLYQYNPLLQATGTPLRDGNTNKIGANISGGTSDNAVTYFIGGETQSTEGVTRSNDLDRTNLRANVSGLVNTNLRINAQSAFISSYIELPQEGNTGSGPWLTAYSQADPSPGNVARGQGFRNPYTAANVGWWRNEEQMRRFIGSVSADWRPTNWLHINGSTGVDQVNRFEQSTIPVPGLATGFFAEGLREQYRTQNREITANLNANVTHRASEAIELRTAAGVQYNETAADWTYAAGSGLAPGTLTSAEALSIQEFFGETKLFGVYGSQQVGLNDRLFVTAAVRGDQNSAFGDNIGFVVYPALSASWVVREEPWFPQLDALSSLRLRAAYGESGQRPGRLDALRTYEAREVSLGNGITSGFIVSNAGNPDLTAEVSRELELGVDVGLLGDRLALEVTRYNKTTDDALVARPLPPSVGGPISQFFNLGEVKNSGWEADLRLDALRTENFSLRLGMSVATNQNRLVAIGDTTIPPITVGLQRHTEGYPLGGYWAPAYEYSDDNGDGILQFTEVRLKETQDNEDDGLSYMGQPFPKRELSFTSEINFLKMFRVSGLLDFKGGHHLFNWGGRTRCSDATGAYCESRQVPGSASLEEQARIIARRNPAVASSAGYIEKADYWKLREVNLTFFVPNAWVSRTRFAHSLSVSLAGRNLKLWTDYTGWETESNIPGSVNTADDPGRFYTVDLFSVPLPRTFVFRVDVGM